MTTQKVSLTCNGCHLEEEGALFEGQLSGLTNTAWVRPPRGWFVTTAFVPAGAEVHNETTGGHGRSPAGRTLAIGICPRCAALGRIESPDQKGN